MIVLAAGAVAYVMALRLVRAAWIPAAFGAAVAGRDLVSVLGERGIDPAFGLWLATASLALAAVLLFREMARGVRRNVRDSKGLPPER